MVHNKFVTPNEREELPTPQRQLPRMNTVPNALIPYPTGWLRFTLRSPLLFYRLGLGGLLNAIHLMVLTTRGRATGQPRHTPIEYRRHGSKIYLVSGWGERPNWYQNIVTHSLVTVQLGRHTYSARGSIVTDEAESLRALHLFRRIAPARYDAVLGRLIEDEVNAKTLPDVSAQFTIVRLDITPDAPSLPGLPTNLAGFWPLALLVGVGAVMLIAFSRPRRSDFEGENQHDHA